MELASLVRSELIFPDLPGSDRQTVLRAISERIAGLGLIRDAETLYGKLCEREELGSTAVGDAVAIPHCKMARLEESIVAVGLSRSGVEFGATDQKPVRLFFILVSPADAPAEHLRSLASISRWIQADHHVERILELTGRDEILRFLRQEEAADGEEPE